MGIVFKAFEPALERYVAIKVLRPEFSCNPEHVQYFQQEARAIAALRHPNIVPIHYIGEVDGCAFFSMSFIQGETFDDWIERKQWFTEEQATWFMHQAIAALDAAHQANIIHLDIKPANFLIDRSSTVMLTDFGLAESTIKSDTEEKREAFGTPAYVSPEQIYRTKTDLRTDIYSLGATLYHLLVGRTPFPGETVQEIVWGHMEKPFPAEAARIAGVAKGWVNLMQKMMERNPDDRFANYVDLSKALINVNKFTHETKKTMALPTGGVTASTQNFSVPRTAFNVAGLHGFLSPTGPGWIVSTEYVPNGAHGDIHKRSAVLNAITDRAKPLGINQMARTIGDLCKPGSESTEDLVSAMGQVPGLDYACRALSHFMSPTAEDVIPEAAEVLDTIGPDRARNLALIFYSLNYEIKPHPQYEFFSLWRHQLAVGIIIDFMYDALDLKRTGIEFVTGAFHDVGKIVLAELYPQSYYYVLSRALLYQVPLSKCERDAFGVDHAELGAFWFRHHEIAQNLSTAISVHETPSRVPINPKEVKDKEILAHALISSNNFVKQLGIGYSGSVTLDAKPWQEMNSTRVVWSARRNTDYTFESFTEDFLSQFETFPDLL